MHEYHIVHALVKQVNARAVEQKFAVVVSVSLVLAPDSGLDPESIRLYFSQIAAGTPSAHARLSFETAARNSSDTPAVYIKEIEVE